MKQLTKLYLENYGFVRHQIDSYNAFVRDGIQKIVDEMNLLETNIPGYSVEFGKIYTPKPMFIEADGSVRSEHNPILPMEARLRGISYYSPLYLEMTPVLNGTPGKTNRVFIGYLPVMVKSNLCYLVGMNEDELIQAGEDPMDPGGYFIINGTEKVLVAVEELAPDVIVSSTESRSGKKVATASIFSTRGGYRARVMVEATPSEVKIFFPTSPRKLNAFVVIKAMGISNDKEILELFRDVPEIQNEVMLNLELVPFKTTEEAIEYLGKKLVPNQPKEVRDRRVDMSLDRYILPHIGVDPEDRIRKAHLLIELVQRAISLMHGLRVEDDKDHYSMKRLATAGKLMDELFRYAFRNFTRDFKYQLERAYVRRKKNLFMLSSIVRPDALTTRIRHSMSTGTWPGNRTGVAQLLDRINMTSTYSHLRRVISTLSKQRPHLEARDLHPSHWGKLCAVESPEGQSSGLVKNLALAAKVSMSSNDDDLINALKKLGVKVVE